jgi:APA family basic amino acid/polyamine antiporter
MEGGARSLRRAIGLLEVTLWGIGIILGAGIYVLIGEAAGLAGNAVWLSFVLGALIASLTGLSYAELSSIFPKEAAEYVYVKIACGCDILSFIVGWFVVLTGIISVSTVALGFAGYFHGLFGVSKELVAIVLIGLLSVINFLGIKESSRLNILFTIVEVLGVVLIIVLGVGHLGQVNLLEAPTGLSGILSAATLIFFAYLGFEDIVNVAEETKNPEKTLPKALLLSIAITTALYILVAMTAVSLVPWAVLAETAAPLALIASTVLGDGMFTVMSFIALFATSNTVLIMLVVGSRMIYGMANEGAFPRSLAKIHHTTHTPWPAILLTMGASIAFLFVGDLELVASVTSLGAFITFIFVNISLIYIRYRRPELKRVFTVPVNVGRFPVLGLLGIVSCLILVSQFTVTVLVFGYLFLLIGYLLYHLSKETKRSS